MTRYVAPAGAFRPRHGRLVLFVSLIVCAGTLASCAGSRESARRQQPYNVIAYVFGQRDDDVSWIDARMLTHINYAFANVDPTGAVVLEREEDAELLAQLNALRAVNPDLKILLSIGGWGWSDHFSDASLTDSSRNRFAETATALVRAHGLDGLDVDWEYPGQPGDNNVFRPEDKTNFTLLLETLRAHLDQLTAEDGRRYLLTIATGANDNYLEHTELDEAQAYLDFVNIMTYDFYGSYTRTTGHHTNLASSEHPGAGVASGQSAVEAHIDAGVPPEKIILGAAFYGKGWEGVSPVDNGLYQQYEQYAGSYPYGQLVTDYIDRNGFMRHWDEAAHAPYLWNADSTIFISYEDPESLQRKAQYVIDRGLAGMMYWQHTHDPEQELIRSIDAVLNPD